MKISEQLRAAGKFMDKHGYSHFYEDEYRPKCGCFLYAIATVAQSSAERFQAKEFLREFVGDYSTDSLEEHGWNKRDAVAALEIAADIAECEGL